MSNDKKTGEEKADKAAKKANAKQKETQNWESQKRRLITAFFALVLVPVAFQVYFTILHEEAHREIYSLHGLESSIHIGWDAAYTKLAPESADAVRGMSDVEISSLINAQSNVESFGYQLQPIMLALSYLVGFSILILFIKYE